MTFRRRSRFGLDSAVDRALKKVLGRSLMVLVILGGLLFLFSGNENTTNIGKQPSLEVAERVALRALSRDIDRYSSAKWREVVWRLEDDYYGIQYKREDSVLTFHVVKWEQADQRYRYKDVSEQAIHEVAAKRGRVEDLVLYGARSE